MFLFFWKYFGSDYEKEMISSPKKHFWESVPTVVHTPVELALERELARQQVSLGDIQTWAHIHRAWGLTALFQMSSEDQKLVAMVARYLYKHNRSIGSSVLWREAAAFVHYCRKYGTPLSFAVAVAHVESHFDPRAQSSYGAAGIMQIMWRVHDKLMKANGIPHSRALHDPDLGVAAGVLLLARYLRATGSQEETLKRYLGASVQPYVKKVLRYTKALEKVFGSALKRKIS